MDTKIIDLLNVLDKEPDPSQRTIAKKTGFSLGLVNALLKKAVKKGLVKIIKLNSRNIKYILTPEGIREKTNKSIKYIKDSYHAVKKLEMTIKELARKHDQENKDIYVFCYEENDEILELVISTFYKMDIDFTIITSKKDAEDIPRESVIYHWNTDNEFEDVDAEEINIFRN